MKPSPSTGGFLGLPAEFTSPDTAGCVVLPVPYEATSTFGEGSQGGPAAIIAASHEVELFDAVLGLEPFRLAGGIHTAPVLQCAGVGGGELAVRLHETVAPFVEGERFVVTLGGEHTSVIGAIRAASDHYGDLAVVHLDAHSDLRDEYEGSRWNHACAMRRVLDFTESLVQVGIRSQCAEERAFSEREGVSVFYAHDIHAAEHDEDWIDGVIENVPPNVYVTFDCDVFDPSIMPATGTPEPAGLNWLQVDSFFEGLCRRRRLVGMDVSELAPVDGLLHPQFTVARLINRVIGYAFMRGKTEGA